MKAKKCDRCGKFYLKRDNKIAISKITYLNGICKRQIDLCEVCENLLIKWLDEGNTERGEE